MYRLKPGQSLKSRATLSQQNVLDSIQRGLEGLHYSPAPWAKELFETIGPEGVEKALKALEEARESVSKASSIIGVYLKRSRSGVAFTATVWHLLGENVWRCEKNMGDECGKPECKQCQGFYN